MEKERAPQSGSIQTIGSDPSNGESLAIKLGVYFVVLSWIIITIAYHHYRSSPQLMSKKIIK